MQCTVSVAAELCKKITFEKDCSSWMTLKVMWVHQSCHYSIDMYHFYYSSLITTPICHRFHDISTFTVCMTVCDLEKSFMFKKTVEITSHTFWFMRKHILNHAYYISRGMGFRNVSNSKMDLQGHFRSLIMITFERPHTISYYRSLPWQLCLCLALFPIYYHLFVTWPWTYPLKG